MKHLPLLLVLAAPLAFAQGALEVISLRHRTAEQVIPVLRPLLAPGGALSGQYNQLIVRTSPENLAQLRVALDAIDRAPRRLEISVRFDNIQENSRSGIQTDARVSSRGASADIRIQDSRAAQDARVDQRMQVMEGGQAYISAGESRIYGQAGTGFTVMPRLSGNHVSLDIAAQQDAFTRGGAIQGQQAVTTVSARLGEWVELGGAQSYSTRADGGLQSSRDRTSSENRRIWVKVEEIR
jgi:hypothetical protein